MQKVFNLTNKYIIIATPLILFVLLSNVYFAYSVQAGGNLLMLLFAMFLLILMTAAFIAGWFKMVKLAVTEDDNGNPNSIISFFASGVGEYFLPSLGFLFITFILNVIILCAAYYLGNHFIGSPGISAQSLSDAITNPQMTKAFLQGLTQTQLLKLNLWNILLLTAMAAGYFFLLLYIPVIFFKNKNPFIAFLVNLKDLFSRNFIKTLGIYILIFVINFIISILSALLSGSIILYFIMTFINFYFICAAAVGVFYYYYSNFINNQIGTNIDTTV